MSLTSTTESATPEAPRPEPGEAPRGESTGARAVRLLRS